METYYLAPQPSERQLRSMAHDPWLPLQLLNGFRTILAGLFVGLYLSNRLIEPLGEYDAGLFFDTSVVYLAVSMVLWFLHIRRRPAYTLQLYFSVIADILLITLLMYASGGVQSGLGVLLILTIAISSINLGSRSALGIAALATLVVLGQQIYTSLSDTQPTSYPVAGLLGVTYFITSIIFVFLARRIRETEDLAQRRGVDLANLAQLTQHIIQRMQTGVLVIDHTGSIRLLNESAAQMLGIDERQTNIRLDSSVPELAQAWRRWVAHPERQGEVIRLRNNPIDIAPRFARISDEPGGGALIFLQDMAAMAQQAQQLQLASLGRLSASIAHEIRNPLGAISHAGQLLAESDNLDQNDQRLTRIIADHSQRLNKIVENVMSVSRRKPSQVELFNLRDYIVRFSSDYATGYGLGEHAIEVMIEPADTMVRFDLGHLHQILTNLCDNGLRHGKPGDNEPCLILRGGFDGNNVRPHLDIIDNGPGVQADAIAHLFEPFFTTESKGTGLGLYLSRELAEGNQAHLNYVREDDGNGFFRLTFQDPRRQID